MNTIIIIIAILLFVALATIFAMLQKLSNAKSSEAERIATISLYSKQISELKATISDNENALQQLRNKAAILGEKNASSETSINNLVREKDECNDEIKRLNEKLDEQSRSIINYKEVIAELNAKLANADELHKQMEKRHAELNEQSRETFKNIASELLKQNANDLKTSNETRMAEIIKPFNENIDNIKKSIKDYYENGLKETSSLKTTIAELTRLNTQLGKEANELTTALRGNRNNTQGPWGEMILRQILEGSGLIEGTNFVLQATHNADGSKIDDKYRPDALLFFPNDKVLIVDSKVNITAYTNYANATDEEERKQLLSEHVRAVEAQVNNLSNKCYPKAVKNSADFVIMFMPNEGAYIAAMQGDNMLWQRAYNKQVLIVSPTHLISVVKMMEQLWNNDKQNKNALRIAEESGKLIDKLAGFVKDLEDVGTNMQRAQKSYEESMKKLKTGTGNILRRADNIKQLGAKATKQLPAPEDDDINEI